MHNMHCSSQGHCLTFCDGACLLRVVSIQATDTCGNIDQSCCYDANAPLCSAGLCNPGTPAPDSEDVKKFPCVCSDATCVKNADYCPPDSVCDQTPILDECGSLNAPCCGGTSCDEDVIDPATGGMTSLVCNQAFADAATAQTTRCEIKPVDAGVQDQSFGCGGPAEQCCAGEKKCDNSDLACECALHTSK
jgi:hypothetical protein